MAALGYTGSWCSNHHFLTREAEIRKDFHRLMDKIGFCVFLVIFCKQSAQETWKVKWETVAGKIWKFQVPKGTHSILLSCSLRQCLRISPSWGKKKKKSLFLILWLLVPSKLLFFQEFSANLKTSYIAICPIINWKQHLWL